MSNIAISLRMLRRAPAFTITVIATIALGIGATSLILAVFDTVVLQAVRYPEVDRLITIALGSRTEPARQQIRLSLGDITLLQARSTTLESLAAYLPDMLDLRDAGPFERVPTTRVSAGYFATLGVPPLLGRTLGAQDTQPGHEGTAVLSYDAWQKHFAADPHVVGRPAMLQGKAYTIVGVMPRQFRAPGEFSIQFWIPIPATSEEIGGGNYFVIGRARAGITLDAVRAELHAIGDALARERPNDDRGLTFEARLFRDAMLGSTTRTLWMLFATVVFVMLTACANVASLLLLRSASRQRETAVRLALGASRADIIRRFVGESLVLTFTGGVFGTLLAVWGARVLRSVGPTSIPRLREVTIEPSILALALGLCLLAAIVVTTMPVIHALTADLSTSLREGALISASGFGLLRGNRSQHLFALCQIAIVVILVAGFGLFARSLSTLLTIDVGFDPRHLLALVLDDRGRKQPAIERMLEEVSTLPGVEAAAITSLPPHLGLEIATKFLVERASGEWVPSEDLSQRSVSPRFFETMRIPLVRGRDFTTKDRRGAPYVMIVNEAFARQFWPHENPIGRRVNLSTDRTATQAIGKPTYVEVVGVVGNVRDIRLSTPPQPEVYYPIWQSGAGNHGLLVRTQDNALMSANAILHRLESVDPQQKPAFILSMSELVDRSIIEPRFYAVLFGMFAGLATMLAAVGVYGVSAYAASRRTREIGIRLVLGARRGQIVGLVVCSAAIVTAIGVIAGMLAAIALSRFVTSLLFEVKPLDPITFVITPLLVGAIALIACYLPARRAARLEPGDVLRVE
jgi:predicted permease